MYIFVKAYLHVKETRKFVAIYSIIHMLFFYVLIIPKSCNDAKSCKLNVQIFETRTLYSGL